MVRTNQPVALMVVACYTMQGDWRGLQVAVERENWGTIASSAACHSITGIPGPEPNRFLKGGVGTRIEGVRRAETKPRHAFGAGYRVEVDKRGRGSAVDHC